MITPTQKPRSLPTLSMPLWTAAACLALAAPGTAHAASTTTTFNVTATVVDSCAVSASDLAFGTYDPASATDKTGTSTVNVTCSLGTAYTVSLNNGTHASGSTRRLAAGASRLTYQVYKDVGATLIFGAIADTLGVSGIGTGVAIPSVIYGVIPKTQNVGSGSYSDQITVTIDY
jgi:spore coat protein U-like protein